MRHTYAEQQFVAYLKFSFAGHLVFYLTTLTGTEYYRVENTSEVFHLKRLMLGQILNYLVASFITCERRITNLYIILDN